MTSLIAVISLLLLFFMLTSTFTRFSEIQLSAAGGGAAAPAETSPLFLQFGAESLSLNGTVLTMSALPAEITAQHPEATVMLVSATDDVTSQRLVDLLVTLAPFPALSLTVLD
ncbi:biopolymer transporter ExbD [Gymnodinialimonas sp. 57CJ19]|uniref:ExbD/TolR family protein n=1 Tax=Gymnodinialimonas sp. 57CJ19 TaxID=3138498 RepID=UPI0031345EE0